MERNSISFSKLTDKEMLFEDIIMKLDTKLGEEIRNEPHFQDLELKTSFTNLTDQLELNIHDTEYNFKVYQYIKEEVNKGFEHDENRETRISTNEMVIIVFTNGAITQYLVNKSINDAKGKSILRMLLDYKKQGEIISNNISILADEEFYLWLFYTVINETIQEENLSIESIEGYRGSTEDTLTYVSGGGSELLNLISTLTFIFESETINRIKVKVKLSNDYFVIDLYNNGNIKISISEYQGAFDLLSFGEKISKISLTVFLEILPRISSIYSKEVWDKDNFKKDIGNKVITRINEKIPNN